MDSALLNLILASLVIAVAFNLFLTFRLIRVVTAMNGAEVFALPLTLPAGHVVPEFHGQALYGRRRAEFADKPTVLVFLSSQCGDCKHTLPELSRILPALEQAEVSLWVVVAEKRAKVHAFLGDTGLLAHAVRMDTATRNRVNPRSASPFYLFLDEQRVLQASGMIGDEDWHSFMSQMDDILAQTQAA